MDSSPSRIQGILAVIGVIAIPVTLWSLTDDQYELKPVTSPDQPKDLAQLNGWYRSWRFGKSVSSCSTTWHRRL